MHTYVEVEPELRVRCDEAGTGSMTLITLNDLADLAPDSNLRIFLEHIALRDAEAA